MTREEILLVAKPILFNTDMVEGILDCRKTETRRLIKPPYFVDGDENNPGSLLVMRTAPKGSKIYRQIGKMPYPDKPYKIGDYLYVRETWSTWTDGYVYKAWTSPFPQPGRYNDECMTWYPSIHMPKEAARIFLRVTDVRIERLQAMTLEDFLSEGVVLRPEAFNDPENAYQQAKRIFIGIWDSTTNELKYKWENSPWVWVIEFERVIPD